jgi:hypothetical protein
MLALAPAAEAAKPKLSAADSSVSEAAGVAELTVKLSKRAARTVRIDLATEGGSAAAGSDYAPFERTLRLRAGKRRKSVGVALLPDAVDEPDETILIDLSDPRRAKLADGEAVVTILDDDPPSPPLPGPPAASLATASVAEGTSGTTGHQITVELNSPSAAPSSLHYATASDTATSDTDFDPASGDLAFDPGETSATFPLTVTNDYADEPDEDLVVTLSDPVNATVPAAGESLTILDDDPPCTTADTPDSSLNLGSISGDTGTPSLSRSDEISPCGDTDWFQFTVTENSDSNIDPTARINLSSVQNDSPAAGDVDLCVHAAVAPGTEVCSTSAAGLTETLEVCSNDEQLPPEDDTVIYRVEVDGFGNAVNDYDLQIAGNVAVTSPDLQVDGACG